MENSEKIQIDASKLTFWHLFGIICPGMEEPIAC